MVRLFFSSCRTGMVMNLYLYENYKDVFPDARGSALTDLLILDALREYGVCAECVERTEKGKPYIAEHAAGRRLHISVSHSGTYFGCLLSEEDEGPLGLDIQQARNTRFEKISSRYFTDEEQRYIEKTGRDGFFFLWVRKEAYCKYTGRGLAEILDGTSVLGRTDVDFTDFQLEKGIYCSCCRKIQI